MYQISTRSIFKAYREKQLNNLSLMIVTLASTILSNMCHCLNPKKGTIVYYTIPLNYGTMDNPMVLCRELWNFDLQRKNTP